MTQCKSWLSKYLMTYTITYFKNKFWNKFKIYIVIFFLKTARKREIYFKNNEDKIKA